MSSPPNPRPGKKHILTVAVEDYFHSQDLSGAVLLKHWDRLESRLSTNIDEILEFLGEFHVTATFFIFGWTAERYPEMVRRIVAAGHEVASRGYWPRRPKGMIPEEFRADLRRTKDVLEAAGSNPIVGFRAPAWIRQEDTWILDVLAEEGYLYDSSINPVLRRFARDPRQFRAHKHRHYAAGLSIWEFPVSTIGVFGMRVAISGGNYIRQFPHTILRHAVDWWDRNVDSPLVFYFMPWEFDNEQPQIGSISALNRVRHYRNLAKTRWVLREHFARYNLESIGDYLGVARVAPSPQAAAPPVPRPDRRQADRRTSRAGAAPPPVVATPVVATPVVATPPPPVAPWADLLAVTIVVPVFNETENIVYLQKTLAGLRERLAAKYRIHLSVVDDASSDDTWQEIKTRFAGVPDFAAHRHPSNRGIAAAILTGILSAPTELVASIDCDCSYDPAVLEEMIPLMADADLVTASPYHPQGQAVNVPRWRLFLSRGLSRIYSVILGYRIHTFTSCCRVYRKTVVAGLHLQYDDFLGIAEMLIRARQAGARIVEHPATLEARLLGASKMKTARTIRRHLRLIRELIFHAQEPVKVKHSSVQG